MGKPEIQDGKSNYSRHSNWEASENMGCDLRWCNFSILFSLLSWFGYSLLQATFSHYAKFSSFIFMQRISTWGDFWMVSTQDVCFTEVWTILYSVFIINFVKLLSVKHAKASWNWIQLSKASYNILTQESIICLPKKKLRPTLTNVNYWQLLAVKL